VGLPPIARHALWLSQLALASLMVVGREALTTLPPAVLLISRLAGGAALFTVLAKWEERIPIAAHHRVKLLLCALFGAVMNQVFFIYGLQRTTATHASIMSASIPILTLLLATWAKREALSSQKLLGVAIGLSGAVALILFGRVNRDGDATAFGDLLIGGNCVCWAAFLVLVKDLSKTYGPMLLGSRLFVIGTLVVSPFCAPSVLSYLPQVTGVDLGYIAFIILVPTVAAYALNQVAVRHNDASVVATHWYLLPVFGILGATLRLGEPLRLEVLVFALLTCAGVWISAAPPRAPKTVTGTR
jgi:drug/metabolite transporter (DMT)-like permease